MASKVLHTVILGAPASGKGTISSRIVRHFDITHLGSGDLVRNHMYNNTGLGSQAKAYVEDGKLVPDKIMVHLMANELCKLSKDNWLLDGFPRTKHQSEQLFSRYPVDIALHLVVPFAIIIERVAGRWIHLPSGRAYNTDFNVPKIRGKDDVTGEDLVQRPDDKTEAVRRRLEVYAATMEPVLEFYRDQGILKEFHGDTSNKIWPDVYRYLATKMKPNYELDD